MVKEHIFVGKGKPVQRSEVLNRSVDSAPMNALKNHALLEDPWRRTVEGKSLETEAR